MAKATLKRAASDEPIITGKRTKIDDKSTSNGNVTARTTSKKACEVCGETGTTFSALPAACQGLHPNDICRLCYTKYINTKIMADVTGAGQYPHSNCNASISHADIRRIIGRKNCQQ